MATVAYAARVLSHLEHAVGLPIRDNPPAAFAAAEAIRSAVGSLALHPLLGRRVYGDVRELVISYGRTGYVVLYRFVVPRDEVRVLGIRHQREIGFVP